MTVDESQTSGYLAPDFIGLSYEASQLPTSGFDPTKGNLVALLRTLNKWGNLRIGGNTVDRETFWQPNDQSVPSWASVVIKPSDIDRLARFSRATNWKVELAMNLGHLDATSIASEAQYVSSSLGRQLKDLECGAFLSDNYLSLIRHQIAPKLIADGRQTGGVRKSASMHQKGTSGEEAIWHHSKVSVPFSTSHRRPCRSRHPNHPQRGCCVAHSCRY